MPLLLLLFSRETLGTNTSAGGPISMLTIRMGVQLMLAQAQLCFYEKVTTPPPPVSCLSVTCPL